MTSVTSAILVLTYLGSAAIAGHAIANNVTNTSVIAVTFFIIFFLSYPFWAFHFIRHAVWKILFNLFKIFHKKFLRR
jgi:hypothetical protein